MRRLKRISFFLYSCLLFAVGFYGHYKIEQWFYPGRQAIISQNEIQFFQMQSATQAVSVPDRLRADTKLVVKNTDQVSRRQTEEIKSLPLRLIGCSREEVEDEIVELLGCKRRHGEDKGEGGDCECPQGYIFQCFHTCSCFINSTIAFYWHRRRW